MRSSRAGDIGSVFGCCDPNAVARPALSGQLILESKTMKKQKSVRRSPIARDLRTPKYKPRVVPNKKRNAKVPRFDKDDGDAQMK
jgi:hypothetical protein